MLRSLVVLTALAAAHAGAVEKTRIVVLPISASNDKLGAVAASIAEQVQTELGKGERLQVIGASDVQAVVGLERQRQVLGCADANVSCFAELSAAMGAPWVVTGSLAQLGKALRLDLKLIRAADAMVMFRGGQSFKDESEVFEAVSVMVEKLVTKIEFPAPDQARSAALPAARGDAPVKAVVEPPTQPPIEPAPGVEAAPTKPVRWGPWVVAGGGLLGVAVGATLFGTGTALYRSTSDQRQNLQAAEAMANYTGANRMKAGGIAALAVGFAALSTGVAWLMWGTPSPSGASVTIVPGPGSVTLMGEF